MVKASVDVGRGVMAIGGELITLRDDIRRAIPRTTDRETLMHLQGAEHQIGDILDPKK
jgi:hypothetical protein